VDVRGPHGADASRGEERVDAGVRDREGVELEGPLGGDVLTERVAHPGGEHDTERLVEDPRPRTLRGDGLPDRGQHRVDGAVAGPVRGERRRGGDEVRVQGLLREPVVRDAEQVEALTPELRVEPSLEVADGHTRVDRVHDRRELVLALDDEATLRLVTGAGVRLVRPHTDTTG